MSRTTFAFFIAPFVSAVFFIILIYIPVLVFNGADLLPAMTYSWFILLMFAMPVSYGVSVVIGIPAFLMFKHFGWLTVQGLLIGGSSIGLLVGLIGALLSVPSKPLEFITIVLLFISFGTATGYVFWRLACKSLP